MTYFAKFPDVIIDNQKISSFEVIDNQILLLHVPVGYDVNVFNKKTKIPNIDIQQESNFIPFQIVKLNNKEIRYINDHFEYLKQFSLSLNLLKHITEKNIVSLSGIDIRLINTFYYIYFKKCNFIEINIAGLSIQSVHCLLNFLTKDFFIRQNSKTIVIIDPLTIIFPNPTLINVNNSIGCLTVNTEK